MGGWVCADVSVEMMGDTYFGGDGDGGEICGDSSLRDGIVDSMGVQALRSRKKRDPIRSFCSFRSDLCQ